MRELINATRETLSKPLSEIGISKEVPAELTEALQENIFYFSGFKTHHEMVEASRLMKGDDGAFKPFEQFKRDVQTIDNTYNRNYLKAEYNFAVQSTQMAVKWKEWEKDGDDYDLQYRTAGDERVREEHAALDMTTLPPSDPFWDSYLPPLGWNCRCTAVQVRKDKYPRSNSAESIAKGQAATAKPKQQIFRFNPGKQEKIFPPKHPYYKAPGEVKRQVNEIVATKRTSGNITEEERAKRKTNRKTMAKQGRELNRNRRITYEIDGKEYEFDFRNFGNGKNKVDICHHYAASMFGDDDFFLKNKILLNPQPYLDKGVTVGNAAIDHHNSGVATQKLKDATDRFFYIRTTLDNGNEAILHVGRYRDSGKLYLYAATKELPLYAKTPQ